MADLNALIAQGAKFDMPNPINQMAQMMQMRHLQDQSALAPVQLQHAQQQNQMNQMLMQEKQRGFQEQNALRSLMGRQGFTLANPEHVRELHATAPNLAENVYKGYLANTELLGKIAAQPVEAAHKAAQTGDLNEKTLNSQLANFNKVFSPLSVNNPDDVKAYTMAMYNDPNLGPLATRMKPLDEALRTNLAEFARDPKMWQTAHAQLSGKDIFEALKGTRQNVNLGNVSQGSTINAFGDVVPGSQASTPIGPVASTAAASEQARAATSNAATNAAREARLAKGPVGTSLTAEQNDALFGENGAVAAGKLNPNKINSRNASMWADAFLRNPNADPVKIARDVETTTKAVKDFGTGPQGVKITAFNTAIDHLDTLSQLGAALKNGDMVAFNNVANFLGVQTGQPAAAMYNQAARIVGAEISKAIVPGVGTGKEREETAKAFNSASSPDQLAGADVVAKKLLGGQLASLEQQYKRTTKREDFAEQLLSPAGRKAYQNSRNTPADAAAKPSLGEIFR